MNTFAQPIRNSKTPLSMDQIRKAAPSAFATAPHASRSSRYAFIPTVAVIEHLLQSGLQVFAASQSRSRIEGKSEFTKHMIRFRADNQALTVGDTFPEVVLINGHDGSTLYKLLGGIFKLICSNGAIVADSMIAETRIQHSGKVLDQVASGSIEIVKQMPKVIDAVQRWKEIQLSAAEQQIFAEAAHIVRFADSTGKTDTPIKPAQLLTPRRSEDRADDLLTVFNRVQENMLKGGLSARSSDPTTHFRRTTTRDVKGIDQDVRLNRAVWTLAENMAALKS